MSTPPTSRRVSVERTTDGRFAAINERGGRITLGRGDGDAFTPTELLLAAIGGCTAIDVDILTSRRAHPDSFEVAVEAMKVRDDSGNRLADIVVTFRARFPEGADGDAARDVLPRAVQRSHDQLCTVGRTVELNTPIATCLE